MTVVHPYQPFPKPESTTTHAQMVEKLAARVGSTAPKPAPDEPLKWVKGPDKWVRVTECGTYKIRVRCVEPGTPHSEARFNYEAFRVVKDHWDFSLGISGDPAEARELCQKNREEFP